MVSNCGKNEFGGVSGGSAGDQTSKEFWNIAWYNFGQTVVYRHPNRTVANLIADLAVDAAENPNIGYDQPRRLTFYQQLMNCGWNPSAISTPCDADCSSATAAIILAAGHQLALKEDEKLKKLGNQIIDAIHPSDTTWDLSADLENAGFKPLRDSKYLKSDSNLLAGDINLNPSAHVNINTTSGAKARTEEQSMVIINPVVEEDDSILENALFGGEADGSEKRYTYLHLERGDGMETPDAMTRHKVKALQEMLVINGYTLDVDGEFGRVTQASVMNFREDRGLDLADGVCDEDVWKELIKVEV